MAVCTNTNNGNDIKNNGNINENRYLHEIYFFNDYELTKKYKSELNWDLISMQNNLPEDFIRIFKNYVNLELIFKYQHLSQSFIDELKNK